MAVRKEDFMKLYIKQKVFSYKDKFTVKDENEEDRYFVESELFSFGKKLKISDANGNELAVAKQKVMSFMPKFIVEVDGRDIAEITKKFKFLKPEYYVSGLDWKVEGDYSSHNYSIMSNDKEIASIHKVWMSWGDSYELTVDDDVDNVVVLAVVLAIDFAMDIQNN